MRPDPRGPGPHHGRAPLPPLAGDPRTEAEPAPPSPGPRDAHARSVRRVTVGVAAAAVLGTAVFAGLAAAGSGGAGAADGLPAATGDDGPAAAGGVEPAATGDDAPAPDRFFDRGDDQALGQGEAPAPSPSNQVPVAPSGGS